MATVGGRTTAKNKDFAFHTKTRCENKRTFFDWTMDTSDHPSELLVSLSASALKGISADCGVPILEATDAASSTDDDDDNGEQNEELVNTFPRSSNHVNVSVTTVKRINFLVVGPAGSGKSTFCKRLLRRYFSDFEFHRPAVDNTGDDADNEPTVAIGERGRGVKIQGNTKIIITIVDTPGKSSLRADNSCSVAIYSYHLLSLRLVSLTGFGDSLNNDDRFKPVEEYIMAQNFKYEKEELFRKKYMEEDDTRVHCCFYFLAPHRTTPLDCEFLRRLQSKVAITPIVAKADTMTISELGTQLRRIHNFLQENSISIFDYEEKNIDLSWMTAVPTIDGRAFKHIAKKLSASQGDVLGDDNNDGDDDDDDEEDDEGAVIPKRPQIPNVFAVISGERHYIWGKASEEDPSHSDMQRLHKLLFRDGSLGKLQQHSDTIHDAWRLDVVRKQHEEKRRRLDKQKMLAREKERLLLESKAKADKRFQALLLLCIVCLIVAALDFASSAHEGATLEG